MIRAVDTDVLVNWAVVGAPRRDDARSLIESYVRSGGRLGLSPQVCWEFLHVVTDGRRFSSPMPMVRAVDWVRRLWNAPETAHLLPTPTTALLTLELLEIYRLGRKRILDAALAATIESAGIQELATFNGDDFRVFPFLTIVEE